ncbi:hypothetical protein XAP412_230095 [Xanthomonas phaseoli pv. phaseoli]|nr:hypothetical protein XAP412_230095 [Xanthomonas phaseoli pv. phaseoli]
MVSGCASRGQAWLPTPAERRPGERAPMGAAMSEKGCVVMANGSHVPHTEALRQGRLRLRAQRFAGPRPRATFRVTRRTQACRTTCSQRLRLSDHGYRTHPVAYPR